MIFIINVVFYKHNRLWGGGAICLFEFITLRLCGLSNTAVVCTYILQTEISHEFTNWEGRINKNKYFSAGVCNYRHFLNHVWGEVNLIVDNGYVSLIRVLQFCLIQLYLKIVFNINSTSS